MVREAILSCSLLNLKCRGSLETRFTLEVGGKCDKMLEVPDIRSETAALPVCGSGHSRMLPAMVATKAAPAD